MLPKLAILVGESLLTGLFAIKDGTQLNQFCQILFQGGIKKVNTLKYITDIQLTAITQLLKFILKKPRNTLNGELIEY